MGSRLFDPAIVGTAEQAVAFIGNIIESSTEYSVIGKDLEGNILLWNEGARRMYGYKAEEVVGKASASMLHTPEDIARGLPRQMMDAALEHGKWEGIVARIHKDGMRIDRPRPARVAPARQPDRGAHRIRKPLRQGQPLLRADPG